MFSNMKLAHQLAVSSLAILSLVVIISISSHAGIKNAHQKTMEYQYLTNKSNTASDVIIKLGTARLTVQEFLTTFDPLIEEEAKSHIEIEKNAIKLLINDKEKIDSNLINSQKLINEYSDSFNQIGKDIATNFAIIDEELLELELSTRTAISNLIKQTRENQNSNAIYYTSIIQEKLLIGHLYIEHFLITYTISDLARARDEFAQIPSLIEKLTLEIGDNDKYVLDFKLGFEQYLKTLIKIENTTLRINDTKRNINQLGPQINENMRNYNKKVAKKQQEIENIAKQASQNSIRIIIIASALTIIAVAIINFFMVRIIRTPIGGEPREIEKVARRIANGDLSQSFPNESHATGIYKAIIQMNNNLKSIVKELSSSATTLNDSSDHLLLLTDDTLKNCTFQADELAQTTAAMQEMTVTVEDIASSTQNASDAASEADTFAHEGKSVVEETRINISQLVNNLGNVSGIIENLEKETKNVGTILDVIRNVAEQTNLLALNAAIEAARAGEQGRGFAVVADEVRSLASRTQKSTDEIQNLIDRLQAEAKHSVQSMHANVDEANRTSEMADKTQNALQSITEAVGNIRDLNQQIAVAAEEQNVVVKNLSIGVDKINDLANNTSDEAKSVFTQASSLSDISTTLSKIVTQFKVG